MMQRLFGLTRKPSKPNPKEAIIQLRDALDLVEKRERLLQAKVDGQLAIAKENLTKNKKASLMALRKKKQYEEQMLKLDGTKMTLETQILTIEGAHIDNEVLQAIKGGADSLKSIHGNLDINKVDDMMDSIRDEIDVVNEISNAIAQPLGPGMDFDEDLLNEELEQLEQDVLDSQLSDPALIPGLTTPEVPMHEPLTAHLPPRPNRKQLEAENKELEELRASMAM